MHAWELGAIPIGICSIYGMGIDDWQLLGADTFSFQANVLINRVSQSVSLPFHAFRAGASLF